MTTQWRLTAPTMVLSTQGFSGTEIPQGTPETFMYVNSTLEILSTFVHLFIQQSLESFLCVCVCVCVRAHVWRSVFTPWAVWWGLECDEGQDRKELETSHSPRVRGRQKRSLNSPRTIAKTPTEAALLQTLHVGASHQQGAAPGSFLVMPTLGTLGPPESKSAC